MENIVFNNLANVYYWQNYQSKEIDFVVREKEVNTKLIQVSFVEAKATIRKREIDNLVLGSKILKCDDLTLITWSVEDVLKINGKIIKMIPLFKFLLNL